METLMKILGTLLALVTAQGHATVDLHSELRDAPLLMVADEASEGSNFETLLDWYQHGEPLDFEALGGFWSGRCFNRLSKSIPGSTALGYGLLSHSGPAFPEDRLYFIIFANRSPADFFDNYDLSKLKQAFSELGREYKHFLSNPTLNPATYEYDWEPNGNIDERNEFVVYNEFIISKRTAQFPQKYGDKWANPGDVLSMCYYFKNLGE